MSVIVASPATAPQLCAERVTVTPEPEVAAVLPTLITV